MQVDLLMDMAVLILDNDGAWSLTHNHAVSYIGCTDWEDNCSFIIPSGLGAYISSEVLFRFEHPLKTFAKSKFSLIAG